MEDKHESSKKPNLTRHILSSLQNIIDQHTEIISHIAKSPYIADVRLVGVNVDEQYAVAKLFYEATANNFLEATNKLHLNDFVTIKSHDLYGREGDSIFRYESGRSFVPDDGPTYKFDIELRLSASKH